MENADLSGVVDALKDAFSGEEGKQQIQNIISMFGAGETNKSNDSHGDMSNNIEMMFKLQKVMSVMNSGANLKQTALLQALRELLRPERRTTVDSAVKFLGVGRAIKAFKELEEV